MSRSLALVAVAVFTSAANAVDPVDLLKYLPTTGNTICVVNVRSILSSPRAVKGGWDKIDHTEYLAGAVPVHPNVERIVVGTEFAPSSPGRMGTVAVMPTRNPVDLARVAKGFGTEVTVAGGEPTVLSPNGTAFLKLGDNLLGAIRTDHKPDIARFIRHAKTAKVSIQSEYLNAAVYADGTKSHVLIVLDADDLIGPKAAEVAVKLSDSLKANEKEAAAVQAFVAGLKGVRFSATVTGEGIDVIVRLDSATSLKISPEWVKSFVLDLLNRNGAMLEDMPAAVAKSGENYITLSFRVTDPELGYILALVLPPMATPAAQNAIPVAPLGVSAEATSKYYKAVNQVVDDLKKKNKRAKEYSETALWHDAAATKIETLSRIAVDPIALEYALGTSALLRSLADSLRGVPIQAATLDQKAYYYYAQSSSVRFTPFHGLYFDPWASQTAVSTNLPEIRQKQAEVVRQDQENRVKLWSKMDEERATVQVKLKEKFKGGF